MLQVKDLHISVENKEILKGVSLCVNPGEVHAVMGPNGSGKSTLAYALAGHPKYQLSVISDQIPGKTEAEKMGIWLDNEEITEATPDERANKGLYLATQYPMAVPGLTTINFLWQIYKKRFTIHDSRFRKEAQKPVSLLEFRKWMSAQAKALGLGEELLKRGLNDGFSGGEKKKTEVLQMLVSSPKYIILDEIDSGLDVDALKKIALTVAKMAKEQNIGVLVITHYSRILKYLRPDFVHVVREGKIVEEGGFELVEKIEEGGFGHELLVAENK